MNKMLVAATMLCAVSVGSSCRLKDPSSSGVLVTNAHETDDFSAIVELDIGGIGRCTGTFINPTTVLTANHCVRDEVNGKHLDIYITTKDGSRFGARSKIFYDFKHMNIFSVHDLAIVTFDPEASRRLGIDRYFHIASPKTPPKNGDLVHMVGFGMNDLNKQSGAGVKRVGSNAINAIASGLITVFGESRDNPQVPRGTRSGIGPGDSGGPLLNAKGEIIGVTAHTANYWSSDQQHLSRFVDLSHETAQELLRAAYYCPEAQYCAGWFQGANFEHVNDIGLSFRTDEQGKVVLASASAEKIGVQELPVNGFIGQRLNSITTTLGDTPVTFKTDKGTYHTTMAINHLYSRSAGIPVAGEFEFAPSDAEAQASTVKIMPTIKTQDHESLVRNIQSYKSYFGTQMSLAKQSDSARPPRYTMGFKVSSRREELSGKDKPASPVQEFGLNVVEVFEDGVNAGVFKNGDIILSINGRPIDSFSELFAAMNFEDSIKNQGGELADEMEIGTVLVQRQGELKQLNGVRAKLR